MTVTITGNAATLKYDGTEQSVTGYTVACSNGLYTANDFHFAGEAVAKEHERRYRKMGLDKGQFSNTSANFSNVTFVVENDGSLTISREGVVLASDSAEKSCRRNCAYEKRAVNVKVSGDGFVDGEARALTLLVLRRMLGRAKNTFTYTP